jgi:hypothetical protein
MLHFGPDGFATDQSPSGTYEAACFVHGQGVHQHFSAKPNLELQGRRGVPYIALQVFLIPTSQKRSTFLKTFEQ